METKVQIAFQATESERKLFQAQSGTFLMFVMAMGICVMMLCLTFILLTALASKFLKKV